MTSCVLHAAFLHISFRVFPPVVVASLSCFPSGVGLLLVAVHSLYLVSVRNDPIHHPPPHACQSLSVWPRK